MSHDPTPPLPPLAAAYVIGLGKSGNAAARLLQQTGWQVTVCDSGESPDLLAQKADLEAEGIAVRLGSRLDLSSSSPDQPSRIVVSPGVPWDIGPLVQARSMGIETLGEMQLAWQHLQKTPWIAITGTNGKTTTTSLVAAIFQAAGKRSPAFGNIGYAACEVAMAVPPPDWAIAEVSSYQIEASPQLAPHIALFTTFTPDHLARHKTLENYYAIKSHLLNQAKYQVFNGDDSYLRKVGEHNGYPTRPDSCWTSIHGKAGIVGDPSRGVYVEDAWINAFGELIMPVQLFKMQGQHNLQNLLMAIAAARLAGIDKAAIVQAMSSFSGVAHRLELIRVWRGIELINDSKATNYDAAEVGLSAVQAPAVLIAGGDPKEGDDSGWMRQIRSKACAVLLIGDAAGAFAARLEAQGYPHYEIVETMARAVQRGIEVAQTKGAKAVLLSPACASFDQYPNFEARGEDFRQLCQALEP
jgi:UDP-N-acetylmuramoylalanine--D-glutamate ligase